MALGVPALRGARQRHVDDADGAVLPALRELLRDHPRVARPDVELVRAREVGAAVRVRVVLDRRELAREAAELRRRAAGPVQLPHELGAESPQLLVGLRVRAEPVLAGERRVVRVLGGLARGLGGGRRLARGLERPPRVLLARGALDRALVVPLLVDEPLDRLPLRGHGGARPVVLDLGRALALRLGLARRAAELVLEAQLHRPRHVELAVDVVLAVLRVDLHGQRDAEVLDRLLVIRRVDEPHLDERRVRLL